MIRPDAIPVRAEGSHIALPAPTLAELFGKGYRLRGAERVRVVAPGRAEVAVPVSEGGGDLILDPLDLAALGGGPLRLVGPKGST